MINIPVEPSKYDEVPKRIPVNESGALKAGTCITCNKKIKRNEPRKMWKYPRAKNASVSKPVYTHLRAECDLVQ